MKIKRDSKAVCIMVAVLLLILTIVRLIIGVRIPLFLQGDAKYDDFMMVEYAESILDGKWLGDFSYKSMIKTASYSLLLDLGYKLHISYAWMLTLLYIVAVALLTFVIAKLIGNRIFASLFYLFMLYSPVMFHEENVQKIYRGGYIVVFAIFIIASVIGLFACYDDKTAKLAAFSAVLSVSLPVFWYLKEDSVWIMPFVIGGLISALLRCLKAKKGIKFLFSRIVCCLLPLLVMLVTMAGYRTVNKNVYGVYADTDRSGTYFKEVITDILQIDGATEGKAWVTQDKLHEATFASDTLRKMAYDLDMISYIRRQDDGEVHGDFIIWTLREAGDSYGIYSSAENAENYWKQVHEELSRAYEDGKLTRNSDAIYLSDVARGYTADELKEYYWGRISEVVRTIITYDHNNLTLKQASGDEEQIKSMHRLVGGGYIGKNTDEAQMEAFEKTVNFANYINKIYSKTGKLMAFAAFIGILLLFVRFVIGLVKREPITEGWILLLLAGMALTAALVVFAVMWFCNFLTIWKIYDYSCGAVILMEIIEAIGIYYLIDSLLVFIKKKTGRN